VQLEGLAKSKKKNPPRRGSKYACSIVPQPTTLPLAPYVLYDISNTSTRTMCFQVACQLSYHPVCKCRSAWDVVFSEYRTEGGTQIINVYNHTIM
jgi:hypothetical protein